MNEHLPIERHPWKPFVPAKPQLLMLGTFPPKPERWSMDFYYPNKINDMWRIMGRIFHDDANHFWDADKRCFRLQEIKSFLNAKGIALWDTAMAVRRLKDNASDKFLQVVEPINLLQMLDNYPTIKAVVTAGEKATAIIAQQADVLQPAMGQRVACRVGTHDFGLWRMPSSSRAYPMKLDEKAAFYQAVFQAVGIMQDRLK